MTHSLQTPVILLITGPAASGKTTLAKTLARELRLPLFTKDQFKEPLYDAFGAPERIEQHRRMGALAHESFNLVCAELVRAGVSHILEAPFSDAHFTPFLRRLREDHPFRVVQIELRCDGKTLLERFIAREENGRTHPGHQGIRYLDSIRDRLLAGSLPSLAIEGERLVVDTTDFARVNPSEILEYARRALHSQAHTEQAHPDF